MKLIQLVTLILLPLACESNRQEEQEASKYQQQQMEERNVPYNPWPDAFPEKGGTSENR